MEKRGPKADRLKGSGNWQEAVKRALSVERPADGWPKPDSLYKPRKKTVKRRKSKS